MTCDSPALGMAQEAFERWVRKLISGAELPLSEGQIRQLVVFYGLLCEWNEKMNLTSIVEPKEAAVKHVIDSLMIHRYCPLREHDSVVDVGTGAGIPGMILKIAYPAIRLELLDALRKRLEFLQTAISTLGLDGVTVRHARAEEAGRSDVRESFSVVTARAVAKMSTLLEYCAPLCRVGGRIVAYKGPEFQEELAAAQFAMEVLGVQVENIAVYSLPEGMGERSLVIFRKVASTPPTYPRRPGVPEKRPLQ